MKITKFFIIFSTIYFLNSSLSTRFINASSIDHQNLPQSICKIINDVTKSKTDTQDILIGNLQGNNELSIIDDIIECVKDNTAIVVTDFKAKMTEKMLRKAAIIILLLDKLDKVNPPNFTSPLDQFHKILLFSDIDSETHQRKSRINDFPSYVKSNLHRT